MGTLGSPLYVTQISSGSNLTSTTLKESAKENMKTRAFPMVVLVFLGAVVLMSCDEDDQCRERAAQNRIVVKEGIKLFQIRRQDDIRPCEQVCYDEKDTIIGFTYDFNNDWRTCCCGDSNREVITPEEDRKCREKAAEMHIDVAHINDADLFVLLFASDSSASCQERCINLSRRLGFHYDERSLSCCCGEEESAEQKIYRKCRAIAQERQMTHKSMAQVVRFTEQPTGDYNPKYDCNYVCVALNGALLGFRYLYKKACCCGHAE